MPKTPLNLSPWQKHVERWGNGCGSDLCGEKGVRVCLGRGQVPCDVLFVGEAPGDSENALGRPFVGPAGKLLDGIIAEAMSGDLLRIGFTNIVGCFPKEAKKTQDHAPPDTAIRACSGRLKEFIRDVAKPKLIVWVGQLAEKHGPKALKGWAGKTVAIAHPSSILRMNIAQQGLAIQRAEVTIRNAIQGLS